MFRSKLTRPVLAALLLINVATLTIFITLRVTNAQDNEPNGNLFIHLSGRFPADFTVPYDGSQTGGELAQVVAEKVGVKHEYLSLYRSSASLVSVNGDGAALTHMDRDPAYHVNSKANGSRTLADQGIAANDDLKILLRPLHGDHIHYAISIFYKGKALDMTMIHDRPLLAVGNNMTEEEMDSEDRCSPGIPGYQQAVAVVPDDEQPYYVGPRVWEGNHIDNVYPHFGIHMGHSNWFGMGLMHIHPATGWQWFEETEGLGANLDALFDQVGIWIWEDNSRRYPFHTPLHKTVPGEVVMDFPAGLETLDGTKLVSNYPLDTDGQWSHCEYPTNRILISNDDEYMWRLYYWPFSRALETYSVLEENIGRVWLHENMGMMSLSYEERNSSTDEPPRPLRYAVEYMWSNNGFFHLHDSDGKIHDDGRVPHDQSGVSMLGFDGGRYPMPNMTCDFWGGSKLGLHF
ncbi:hypothetical protein KFU94_66820 [Chloroflexi bacterium TSY]|nr:hypothetical protein [Chloroflexi bacterium TSY]